MDIARSMELYRKFAKALFHQRRLIFVQLILHLLLELDLKKGE